MSRVRGRDDEGGQVDEHDVARREVAGGEEATAARLPRFDGDVRGRHE